MGIFTRVSDILTANINSMLDRAEDPGKMIAQMIREMEEAVQAAKRNVAQVRAGQKKLERELQTNKRLCEEWEKKAEQAVQLDRDDLARQALARKKEHEDLVKILEQQYESGQQAADNLRQTLRGLEAKLAGAKRSKMLLVARKKTAEAQIAAQTNLARGRDAGKAASFAKFEGFEDQVDDLEAEAEALREIDEEETAVAAEIEGLTGETDVELELERLKRKVKGEGQEK